MDDRLKKALDHANYQTTLTRQKDLAKTRFLNASIFAINGGMFTVDDRLISFVSCLIDRGDTGGILIDDKQNPVMIDDLFDFKDRILSVYTEAVNEYYESYQQLRKARTVSKIVGV